MLVRKTTKEEEIVRATGGMCRTCSREDCETRCDRIVLCPSGREVE